MTIFTDRGDLPRARAADPIPDREAIRATGSPRWSARRPTSCELLNLYLDGDTAIAEWEAEFDDLRPGCPQADAGDRAVLTFEGHLIASLREYWASEAGRG